MRRTKAELEREERRAVRGGEGRALLEAYLRPGEMAGVEFVSRVTLDPHASIGEHPHPGEEELYLVLQGEGEGILDGEAFPVAPGDAFLCRKGHTHGLRNTGNRPLSFLALLTKA